MLIFSFTTSYSGILRQFVLEVSSNFVFGICPIGQVELTICIRTRPAKSGKWRECYLQHFLSSAEICLHKHKKKWIYVFFSTVSRYFGNLWLCGNLAVKITTKECIAFIWFRQNLLVSGKVLTLQKLFHILSYIKGIFGFPKNKFLSWLSAI